jgi:hypothetical protein
LESNPQNNTVEENWTNFKDTLIEAMKKHIPQKKIYTFDVLFLESSLLVDWVLDIVSKSDHFSFSYLTFLFPLLSRKDST